MAFTLTTSTDNITGTSGNDTILGDGAGGSATSKSVDQVAGGAGTDTFKLYNLSAQSDVPTLSGVEVLELVDANAPAGFDLSGVTELTTLKLDNATTADTFIIGAGVAVEMKRMADGEAVTLTSTATDTTYDLTVTDMGTIAGAGVTVNADGAGVTTINLATSGTVAAGTDSDIILESTGTETTVNVTGNGELALATNASVVNLNASTHTGKLTYVSGATTTATSIKTGSGNDTVTATAAVNYTIDLGAGNDVLTTADAAGELTSADSIVGGDGTDTLVISTAAAEELDDASTADAAVLAKITGFEQLQITNAIAGDINLGNLGYNYLQTAVTAIGGDRNLSGVTSGFTFEQRDRANSGNDYIVTMNNATAAGTTTDTINIKMNADLTANDTSYTTSFDLNGINIVNISSNDRTTTSNPDTDADGQEGYIIDLAGGTAGNSSNINTVNISGAAQTSYTINAATTGLVTVNGADATGNVIVNGSAFNGTQGVTIKGGSAKDTLTGTKLADVIDGGAGVDIIDGGVGADSLTGGAGNDIFLYAGTTVTTAATFTPATTKAAIDAELITATADGADGNAETWAYSVTIGSVTKTGTLALAAVDTTSKTAVGAAIEAELDTVFGANVATNASGVVTVVSTVATEAVTVNTSTPANWTTGDIAKSNGTDQAQISTLTVGGTVAIGETYSFTTTLADGSTIATSYTAAAATVTDVAAGLVAAFNVVAPATTIAATTTGTGNITLTDEAADNGGFTMGAVTASGSSAQVTGVTVVGSTVSGFDSITDYTIGNDVIRLAAADNKAGSASTAPVAGASVQIDGNGKAVFAAEDDTLAEMITALAADNTNVANNEVVFFTLGSDTYIYGAGSDTTNAGLDVLIKLTGVAATSITESTTTAGDFSIA